MSKARSRKAESTGGLYAWLTGYLTRRSPAALLVDAGLVLILAFIASHLWGALTLTVPAYERTIPEADSLHAAIANPTALMHTIYSILFYLAWFLAIWAAARLLTSGVQHRTDE